ncbi:MULTISPECIES: acyl carrier protein [Psychrobacter]|uniref:acyl carrier protein n=1 Tax=Psychrobacter TaxID=497 RepID=UPI000EBDED5F|nr:MULTISPECIES: acyl carrier protein [Psychrobacter]HCH27810.1 acyl carrier protein [Psychrobacter sp.]
MKQEEVMQIVSSAIEDTFMVDASEVTRNTIAIDIPGWDSLSHTILLFNIEEEIGKELDLEDATFENVGDLVDFVKNQLDK